MPTSQPRHRHLGSDLSDESGGEDSDRGTEVTTEIIFLTCKGNIFDTRTSSEIS